MLSVSNKIYIDTSAFYALMDRSDRHHREASILWPELLTDKIGLVTSSYVVWETLGLLQNRISFEAASLWSRDILCLLNVWWLNSDIHQRAYDLWLNLGRKQLSLVDCASFVTMRHYQIEKVFCFKPHFTDYGFTLIVSSSNYLDE